MNELNPTNAFGELLLDLIESQYQGDIDAGIAALVNSTGLAEEEVVSIIDGSSIVEDENLLSAIIDAFPDADDNDLEVIINVADSVNEEDRAALISGIEGDEAAMDAEEIPAGEMVEGGVPTEDVQNYGKNTQMLLNFNALASEVSTLKQEINSINFTNAITNELKQLDSIASSYVDAERLPPSCKTLLIGNFSDDKQRLAKFSQIAARNHVDVPTMLFATKYALGMLTDASDYVEFKDYSTSEAELATANFSANLDEIVKLDLDAIFNN